MGSKSCGYRRPIFRKPELNMKNRVLYRAMVCLLVLVTACSAAFILVEVRQGE